MAFALKSSRTSVIPTAAEEETYTLGHCQTLDCPRKILDKTDLDVHKKTKRSILAAARTAQVVTLCLLRKRATIANFFILLALMLFRRRRKEDPWEVVGCNIVDPVPMFDDDDDLDIKAVCKLDLRRTYIFDVWVWKDGKTVLSALTFARRQLMQEVLKKGYNVLLYESWSLIVYRRGKQYRIEVRYCGRPARVVGEVHDTDPPCLGVLEVSIQKSVLGKTALGN